MLLPLIAWKRYSLAWPFTMLVSLTSVVISVFNVIRVMDSGPVSYRLGDWAPPVGIEYVLDHLSAFVMLVINAIAFLVLLHAKQVVERELPGKEMPYFTAAIMLLCGFNGIVITGDLFNLYVFLEISSLSLYGLIAAGREKQAPVASFRYLIMGTVAGSFYLLGVGFTYITTGSLNMADVKAILPSVLNSPAAPTILIALALMVLGMGIKMALFPMHGWLPDAYTYAPSTSSAIIAPTGTKVGSYVLLRVMFFVFGVTYVSKVMPVTTIIAWLAAIGIVYGSIMAMAQREMKRMLAYSSVAQIGYIALGIGMANPLGLIGAVLHILNHALMKACLFLVSANLRFKLGFSNIFKLDNTVRKKMPWTMAAFTIAALSMVGLPPMAGFFSKWYLVRGAFVSSNWVFIVVILASSLLNLVYFFRILEKVYMKPLKEEAEHLDQHTDEHHNDAHGHGEPEPEEEKIERTEVSSSMLIPTLAMAAGLIIIGLLNAYIIKGVIKYILPAVGMDIPAGM
jgi:multicomponent Na+:H+ antiporter subunit D